MVYSTGSTSLSAPRYYSVRRGKTVNSCIFLLWQDCKKQVEGFGEAEYSAFDDIYAALNFAEISPMLPIEKSTEDDGVPISVTQKIPVGNGDVAMSSFSPPSFLAGGTESTLMVDTSKSRKKRKITDVASTDQQAERTKICDTSWDQNWEEKYERLKKFKKENGNFRMPAGDELYKWIYFQKKQYMLLQEGRSTRLTAARLKKLTVLGLNLRLTRTNEEVPHKQERNDEKLKVALERTEKLPWEDNYESLKQMLARDENYRKNKKLKRWVSIQRENYRWLIEGKATNMTMSRINKLTDIGLELFKEKKGVSEDRIEQLCKSNADSDEKKNEDDNAKKYEIVQGITGMEQVGSYMSANNPIYSNTSNVESNLMRMKMVRNGIPNRYNSMQHRTQCVEANFNNHKLNCLPIEKNVTRKKEAIVGRVATPVVPNLNRKHFRAIIFNLLSKQKFSGVLSWMQDGRSW
eukprot:CAMPEP_0194349904 /NCGR_PEP_ID=MMETSP0171-20130528/107348_1 /TAXON_ID=218684 /ORGANISM="Corethron pennatum, Strain L29A3" /LENGTH=462 /DNA_ID=CAMNT_0039117403 /DNA_START=108 /DNA_END=1493 /DNA_ORIENTATION=+